MGKKFDAQLPNMTDEDLASYPRRNLNKRSRELLDDELRRRGVIAAQQAESKTAFWNRTNASIAIAGIVVAAVLALIAL